MTTLSGSLNKIVLGTSMALMLVALPRPARAGDGCRLVAEVSIEAVKRGSLAACTRSANPLVCAVALAAEIVDEQARVGVEAGCRYVVKKVSRGKKVRIEVTGKPARASDMDRAYQELKKVQGVKILEKSLPSKEKTHD